VVTSDAADGPYFRQLQAMLRAYNHQVSAVRGPDSVPLNIRALDRAGNLVGGLSALTYWGWLRVEILVVAEGWRGKGTGTRLMRAAEGEARARGCHHAHTSTYAYQGLGFYQRLGSFVVGELADYPEGNTLYWLRKELTGRARESPTA
jgi:GNAT superfamily N-acetyltransferase